MTDQSFFHMNVLRSPYQMPNFGYPGPTFMDIRSKEAELAGCEGMSSTNTRILELRKEKSRDAARSRRGKENYEFYELAKLLPLPAAITSQLDKASIIRLSISYLKLRDFSSHGDPPWHRDGPPPNKSIKGGPPRRRNMTAVAMEIFESHQGTHILQSLDGFGFALSNDGRFLYVSETVSIYLGLSQVEMTGSSVFDYVHVKDHPELAEHLGLALPQGGVPSPGSLSDSDAGTPRSISPSLPDKACVMTLSPDKGSDRSFCIRMKSTLTKRGVHVKTSGYRVVHIIAHHRPQFSFSLSRKQSPPLLGLVALAIALPPPTITELRMENDTFVTRLSPEFKVLYCEPKIAELMDLSADDITNNILYDHCHAADLQKLRKSHVDLLQKGQVMTEYYRLMNKHGGYVWVQTCATTICTAKNIEEQNVVALNYVLSGVEFQGCVMDSGQLKSMPNQETDHSDHSDTGSDQENERRSESKKEPVSRERNHVGESDVTRFGTTSKTYLQSSSTKTTRCNNNHKEFPSDSDIHIKCSPQHSPILESDSVFHDRPESVKPDGKNSRRKMDRPRKRKREVESDCDANGIDSYEDDMSVVAGRRLTSGSHSLHNGDSRVSPDLSSSPHTLLGVSPVPEDLSVKAPSSSPIGLPPAVSVGTTLPDMRNSNSSPNTEWSKTGSGVKEDGMASSSVKDLEEAMNKHLPVLPEGSGEARNPTSDPGSDRSEVPCLHAKQKSTIQWIGSQQPAPDPLAASNLLRSLYANRESVIRTNICNTRPHYYGDHVAVNMLTPPGNDSYKEPPQMSLHPLQYPGGKQPPNHHTAMSTYSNTPITVSMTTHVTDTPYNMTPPSSVSPQDKFVSPFSEGGYADGPSPHCPSTEDLCQQRVPVKPQLYSMPMPAHLPAYADRTSHLSYPNISTYNSTGASFSSYTSSSTNLGAEGNSSWYSSHFATP